MSRAQANGRSAPLGETLAIDQERPWRPVRLGDVATVRGGKVVPSDQDADTLCVELEHIAPRSGQLLKRATARQATSAKAPFRAGDVLFGRLRPYLRKFWLADQDGICSKEIWPLVAQPGVLDSRFLLALVQSKPFGEVAGIWHGTHMPRTDWLVMRELRIDLPPLGEQRSIAAALSDIDALLAALEKLIAKKRAIRLASVRQLVSGQTRLPGFAAPWRRCKLDELGRFHVGYGIRREDLSDVGVPCVRYGEIYTRYEDCIEAAESRIPRAAAGRALAIEHGDLLFACSGESAEDIGRCAVYMGKELALAGSDIIVLRPTGGSSRFLGYLMNHPLVAAQKSRLGQGDVVAHIGPRTLARVEVALPPADEQRAIAAILADMDAELAKLGSQLRKVRTIKQGALEQLLSGRVRLAGCEPPRTPSAT